MALAREKRKEARRLHVGGWSIKRIAERLDVYPSEVKYALEANEQSNLKTCARKLSSDQIAEIVRLYTVDGVGSPQLATRYGVGFPTILRALQRRGITPAERGRPPVPQIRRCRICKQQKSLADFSKISTRPGAGWHGHGYECKACMAAVQRQRGYCLHYSAGLTWQQYQELLDLQNGVCAICGRTPQKNRLSVDHHHGSGSIRGLLCQKCNLMLTPFDVPELLVAVQRYIESPPAAQFGWIWKGPIRIRRKQ